MPARQRGSSKPPARSAPTPRASGSAAGTIDPGVRTERWSNASTFVLAVAGAAIGFKTIWQFPYLASQNGGGAFILIYVLLSALLGLPIVIAQTMLGRRVRASPVKTLGDLGARRWGRRPWAVVGGIAVIGGFIVFSYLSAIAGWTIAYLARALVGTLSGLTADGMRSVFAAFVRDPEKQLFWHSVFTLGVVAIAARGVRRGLEPAVRWVVPALYGVLVVLAVYAVYLGGVQDAMRYLFTPDVTELSVRAWLRALAQVFFSFGLGTGITMMYGAYLKADVSIARAGATAVGLDVVTNVVAAVFVFAVLFGGGVAPASGPTLIFDALPLAFDHLPLGRWAVAGFFALLVLIALALGIALLEPVIVWLEERRGMTRERAAVMSGLAAWLLGLVSVFSFNYAAFSFSFLGIQKNLGAFDILQSITAEAMLPLAALLIAIFAGWAMRLEAARAELAPRAPGWFGVWVWLLRLLAPPLLAIVLFTVYGL